MASILELTFNCLEDLQGRTFPLPYIHVVLNQSANINEYKMVQSIENFN